MPVVEHFATFSDHLKSPEAKMFLRMKDVCSELGVSRAAFNAAAISGDVSASVPSRSNITPLIELPNMVSPFPCRLAEISYRNATRRRAKGQIIQASQFSFYGAQSRVLSIHVAFTLRP